ncbi:DUF2628 domain-containing protein [Pseudomonas sp. ICMP 460]|uniref:DUF2628 domain-containing protein n=1 Tax=Pseudomonas sp. ICMP 460 TaxID=1718917 RepID=UPI000C07B589|nr:DUF2628 domain-containing protein [Pseudomonas sp. ICMP 460]PHN32157.1 hypothetical protein AO240_09115 [Pseudomonas sp. ICMP 460]
MSTTEQVQAAGTHKPKWQERFNFFETYGPPNDPRHKAALKALPTFGKKVLINANVIAFFFGPIYLFVLGLWKKNLALLGIMFLVYIAVSIVFAIFDMELPRALDNGIGLGFSFMYAVLTNYAYYLKEVKGQQGWNPFEGMRL